MSERSPSEARVPVDTVAFGDVLRTGTSAPRSVSEAEPGVEDSTRAPDGDGDGARPEDPARGISDESAPRNPGDVDATPLSQRT